MICYLQCRTKYLSDDLTISKILTIRKSCRVMINRSRGYDKYKSMIICFQSKSRLRAQAFPTKRQTLSKVYMGPLVRLFEIRTFPLVALEYTPLRRHNNF